MSPTEARAAQAADLVLHSFESYRSRFRVFTRRARARFEKEDWAGIRADTVSRLELHSEWVESIVSRLRPSLGDDERDRDLWSRIKEAYSQAILGRDDLELAQSFFNSLTRRVLGHPGIDSRVDFVSEDFPLPYPGWELASARVYATHRVSPVLVRKILQDCPLRLPFRNLEEVSRLAAERIENGLRGQLGTEVLDAVDVLKPVFIRNKGAYLIGRARKGDRLMPIALALLNHEGRLDLDAVLVTENAVSIVFSFARWYFHADVESPREVIGFLQSILPRKKVAELYISLGHHKHGKTELYRELVRHVRGTREEFQRAPGQPGLVMAVFTLPSFEFVFKVIRDTFPRQKPTSRSEVTARYREVLRHDRVGRLVDFQEFEDVMIPRERFSDSVLEELLSEAGRTVRMLGDWVLVRHMYVGRRVRPLDLYLREAAPPEAEEAVLDWGQALKDLARADIFIGDVLSKNFGVTRHGRVVSYDYDELRPLEECNFRRLPESRDYLDEISPTPWFSVSEDDVFPEEIPRFLGLSNELLEAFTEVHGDLFHPDFWREVQRRNREGEVLDFFPYPEKARLRLGSRDSPATFRAAPETG